MRWFLGAMVVMGMTATGYVLLRPRVNRPTLSVASTLPNPLAAEIAQGVRLALQERDSRGGAFRVHYFASNRLAAREALAREEDRGPDLSNVNYSVLLDPHPDVILPGMGREEWTVYPWTTGVLVPLPPAEDGRRGAQAVKALGKRSAAVVSCHTSSKTPRGVSHIHVPENDVDRAAEAFFESASEAMALPSITSLMRDDLALFEQDMGRVFKAGVEVIYVDAPRNPAGVAEDLRRRGYPGVILIPSARLVEPQVRREAAAHGCLTILAHLHPPPADFARRCGSSHPVALAGYRSCLRFLDALDRTRAGTKEEVKRAFSQCLSYDPFLDPALATFGVYRIRAGRFELVAVLP